MCKWALKSRIRLATIYQLLLLRLDQNSYRNPQGKIFLGGKHSIDHHSRDLTRDNILCDPEADLLESIIRQKSQQIMVDTIQILPMLPRIIQSTRSDLRKLACSQKSSWDERIRW